MKKMKDYKKRQKRVVAVLAVMLALLMLLPILTMIVEFAHAANESDLRGQISDLQNSASDLNSKMKDLKEQLSSIKDNKSKALAAKKILDDQMANIEAEINNITDQINLYDSLITKEEDKLAENEKKEQAQYELFCQRVRAMEETGTVSYWSILFNSSSFSDLLDRANLVDEIMEYDNAVMDMLKETRQAIEDNKRELEDAKTEQESAKARQEEAKSELQDKVDEAAKLVTAIESEEDEYSDALNELKAEQDRVDKLIIQRQKELEELINSNKIQFDPGTGYYYPLPSSCTKISSPFGYRKHPISGKYSMHTGIDLPAPKNTNIYAARGGVVSISNYSSSYGNYVVVQHDGGISTLYAHMNSRAVKANDIVKQGQVIGYVGTTGNSTGNHLHFEVRVNGTKVNPVDYYPNVNFTY